MVEAGLNTSITGRAVKNGLISVNAVNIRDYTEEPHGKVDDYPYGGGAGMIMQAQPIYSCYEDIIKKISASSGGEGDSGGPEPGGEGNVGGSPESGVLSGESGPEPGGEENGKGPEGGISSGESGPEPGGEENGKGPEDGGSSAAEGCAASALSKPRVIYTSPAGRVFDQAFAKELAKEEDLIILCGHYEGVDERVLELIGAEDVSIGDYVLTGGELAAMVMVDAVSRMVPGVLSNEESGADESFSKTEITRTETDRSGRWPKKKKITQEYTLLEYPQYTRPREFMGLEVPEILLSGHHENIEKWRKEQALERTRQRRPDMLE